VEILEYCPDAHGLIQNSGSKGVMGELKKRSRLYSHPFSSSSDRGWKQNRQTHLLPEAFYEQ